MARALESQPDHPFLFDYVLGYRRLAAICEAHAHAIRVVTYESLVMDPSRTSSGILSFVGVPHEDISPEINRTDPMLDSSWMGDKKIRETRGIHLEGLNDWETQLSRPEMQAILDSLGSALLTSLGYADVLNRALRQGFVEPTQEVTDAIAARIEAGYEACIAGVTGVTQLDETAGPLLAAVRAAYKHPDEAKRLRGSSTLSAR